MLICWQCFYLASFTRAVWHGCLGCVALVVLFGETCGSRASHFHLCEPRYLDAGSGNPPCAVSDKAKPDLPSPWVLSDLKCMLCCMLWRECLHDECNFHERAMSSKSLPCLWLLNRSKTKGFHIALSIFKLCFDPRTLSLHVYRRIDVKVTASTFGARGFLFCRKGFNAELRIGNLYIAMLLGRVMYLMFAYKCNAKIM